MAESVPETVTLGSVTNVASCARGTRLLTRTHARCGGLMSMPSCRMTSKLSQPEKLGGGTYRKCPSTSGWLMPSGPTPLSIVTVPPLAVVLATSYHPPVGAYVWNRFQSGKRLG